MPSKQSDYTILTDKDGINVWLETEDDKWYYQIIRDDQIVTDNMGPFESKALAGHRALNEYLKGRTNE
jgi:hypothetical protein